MQMGAHERIVVEVRIGGADAVDLLALSGSQRLLRVETPDAFEQSLPAQDLVAAGDHALETVGRVEDRRVAVGDLRVERHKLGVNLVGGNGSVNVLQQFDRALDPYAPMAEQPAFDAQGARAPMRDHGEGCDEVEDDVIVVAGIERDALGGIRLGDAADHVQRAVTIERRDLDGDDVVDRRETPPERHRQHQQPRRGHPGVRAPGGVHGIGLAGEQ